MTDTTAPPKPSVATGPWPEPKTPLAPAAPPRQAVRPKRHKARPIKSNRIPAGRGTHLARPFMQGIK